MDLIYKLLILYKRKLGRKIGYFSTINRNTEKQAIVMIISTYPRFPPFILYFRCKLGVTFARRCFRDAEQNQYKITGKTREKVLHHTTLQNRTQTPSPPMNGQ